MKIKRYLFVVIVLTSLYIYKTKKDAEYYPQKIINLEFEDEIMIESNPPSYVKKVKTNKNVPIKIKQVSEKHIDEINKNKTLITNLTKHGVTVDQTGGEKLGPGSVYYDPQSNKSFILDSLKRRILITTEDELKNTISFSKNSLVRGMTLNNSESQIELLTLENGILTISIFDFNGIKKESIKITNLESDVLNYAGALNYKIYNHKRLLQAFGEVYQIEKSGKARKLAGIPLIEYDQYVSAEKINNDGQFIINFTDKYGNPEQKIQLTKNYGDFKGIHLNNDDRIIIEFEKLQQSEVNGKFQSSLVGLGVVIKEHQVQKLFTFDKSSQSIIDQPSFVRDSIFYISTTDEKGSLVTKPVSI